MAGRGLGILGVRDSKVRVQDTAKTLDKYGLL